MLRGVFTMTRAELDWFYGGGAGGFWPEPVDRPSRSMVPADERHDLIGAYHKRLFGADQAEQTRFARAWAGWESALAVLDPGEARGYPSVGLRARLRPAREPLLHQRRLPRRRRPRAAPTCTGSPACPGTSCRAATT